MFIEKLDRQQWSLGEAKRHIARLTLARREREQATTGETPKTARTWPSPDDPVRRSEERPTANCSPRSGMATYTPPDVCRSSAARATRPDIHRGTSIPVIISPSHWREGQFGYGIGSLEFLKGEFINIRVPRFMVLAIWPEPRTEGPDQSGSERPYTTPYIDMMFTAIRVHGITDEHQSKKEALVAWYREQEIEGERISTNLADSMATLIRLPQSQRGGAKRMIGPDLLETG